LLDNFSIVEEQLREIHEDLPRGFYRELPKLADGHPRVYRLALELVSHTQCALDEETLVRFLQAYQEAAPLSIGENWAFPIMLRLALVENLCQITTQMAADRKCRCEAAETLAQPDGLKRLPLHDALDSCAPMLLELINKLEEQGERERGAAKRVGPAAFGSRLGPGGNRPRRPPAPGFQSSVDRERHHQHAADLRTRLDGVFRADEPGRTGVAARSGERLRADGPCDARSLPPRSGTPGQGMPAHDVEVAQQVVAFARGAVDRQSSPEEHHVGYYIIGPGRDRLHHAVGYQKPLGVFLADLVLNYPVVIYFGGLILLTTGLLAGLAAIVLGLGGSWALAAFMTLLAVVPASDMALGNREFRHHLLASAAAIAQARISRRHPRVARRAGGDPSHAGQR